MKAAAFINFVLRCGFVIGFTLMLGSAYGSARLEC